MTVNPPAIESLVNAALEKGPLGQLLVLKGPPCYDGYHHLERFDDLTHPGRILQGELVGYHMSREEAMRSMRTKGLPNHARNIVDVYAANPAANVRLLYVTSGATCNARVVGFDNEGYQMLLWDLDALLGLST